ncbi:putative ATP-dependent helicase YwqA [Cohnella xylanilytica]|uniref:DEAD/DEAH box helicase n=1 Tax=Cohnella xylanilytica TaxID=557555 RepID=UPI001AFE95A4|nr:DEAD/DEAH box helicase [Cohnella xylanilytica]GIO14266.1 putative ATP-dependent helicase YwqA [Cohnella xylanilytica]
MIVSKQVDTLSVRIVLSEHGDALFYAETDPYEESPGLLLKQKLFAWHEPSFYGTELEIRKVGEVEAVLLPSEEVIPFLADGRRLEHVEWIWKDEAETLVRLAPLLAECLEDGKYAPDLAAYRAGRLRWIWDPDALEEPRREELEGSGLEEDVLEGLRAAFSAAVFHRRYGTEEAAADLRREFPLLFAKGEAAVQASAGLDARSWLVRIGWKTDTAPFRPVLQLLEPWEGMEFPRWRLKLVLQDKRDAATVYKVRLASDGEARGKWPPEWTAQVRERSRGWLEQLRACLPAARFAGGDDVLAGTLGDEDAWRFLTVESRRLLEAGWQVLLPAWWEAARKKKPRLRAKVKEDQGAERGGGKSLFGLNAILSFDWRIAIGDADLNEEEFLALVARGERLVKFRGRWIALDPELLAQIRRAMEGMDKSQGLTFQDVLQLHLLGDGDGSSSGGTDGELSAEDALRAEEEAARVRIEVELSEHLAKLMSRLNQQAEWPKPDIPSGLRAELRGYQRDGFAWLAGLRQLGLGACLADDMGLGKTVQLITYLLHAKASQEEAGGERLPSLIVCPTSVLGNWQKELSRFAPSLRVLLHYGSGRLEGEAFRAAAREADVVLTSYATASLDQETIKDFLWGAVCLDEAQNIKNAQTKQSAAVRSFPARHRIALTGTPIENRLSELWSIYDFMNPGFLGGARAFQDRFATPIERDRDPKRTADLQRLIKPFMLRRKKKDPAIQLDLPDKNEMKTHVHLTTEQAAVYDRCVKELLEKLQKLEGIQRKGAILAALTQLKQACDHPVLLDKESGPEAETAGDWAGLGGEELESLVSRSSKLERLLAMVKELREEGERCLIFTQYLGMGRMIQAALRHELNEPVLYLNGSTSKSQRDRMIQQFQSHDLPPGEQPNVFILSLKAGGVGLNLTAANHVFHFDRWWNPAVENQATDRAYRMGQTKDVQVHKFISLGTLEERIDEMLENKQQLSDDVISGSEGWITELSTEALKDLFTLRRTLS